MTIAIFHLKGEVYEGKYIATAKFYYFTTKGYQCFLNTVVIGVTFLVTLNK